MKLPRRGRPDLGHPQLSRGMQSTSRRLHLRFVPVEPAVQRNEGSFVDTSFRQLTMNVCQMSSAAKPVMGPPCGRMLSIRPKATCP